MAVVLPGAMTQPTVTIVRFVMFLLLGRIFATGTGFVLTSAVLGFGVVMGRVKNHLSGSHVDRVLVGLVLARFLGEVGCTEREPE